MYPFETITHLWPFLLFAATLAAAIAAVALPPVDDVKTLTEEFVEWVKARKAVKE